MGFTTSFLCFFAFLCLVTNGFSQSVCRRSLLKVEETPTGRTVQSKTEWKVNITNTCSCTVYQMKMLCPKFQSLAKIDKSVVSKMDSDHCLINNGQPIYAGTSFTFTYVWDRVSFAPTEYYEACS